MIKYQQIELIRIFIDLFAIKNTRNHTCLRLWCEHEKGFHSIPTIFACTLNLLTRILSIIKYGSLTNEFS